MGQSGIVGRTARTRCRPGGGCPCDSAMISTSVDGENGLRWCADRRSIRTWASLRTGGVDLPGIVAFGDDPVGGGEPVNGGNTESLAVLSAVRPRSPYRLPANPSAALLVPIRLPNGSIMRAARPPPTTSVATAAADQSRFRDTGSTAGLLAIRGPERGGRLRDGQRVRRRRIAPHLQDLLDGLGEHLSRRRSLVRRLRQALEHDGFELRRAGPG